MPISKAEIEKIKKTKGKVRGSALITDMKYFLNKKGEVGLTAVEEKTKQWGQPIDYRNIKNMDWYPVSLRIISILAAQEVFGWNEKDIRDMGYSGPAYSITVKLLMRYFLNLKKTYKKTPAFWAKHYTVGKLETPEFHETEKEKYIVLQFYDFKLHPVLCHYYAGYFLKVAELSVRPGQRILKIEETKCAFKGDKCHEFIIRWE